MINKGTGSSFPTKDHRADKGLSVTQLVASGSFSNETLDGCTPPTPGPLLIQGPWNLLFLANIKELVVMMGPSLGQMPPKENFNFRSYSLDKNSRS